MEKASRLDVPWALKLPECWDQMGGNQRDNCLRLENAIHFENVDSVNLEEKKYYSSIMIRPDMVLVTEVHQQYVQSTLCVKFHPKEQNRGCKDLVLVLRPFTEPHPVAVQLRTRIAYTARMYLQSFIFVLRIE